MANNDLGSLYFVLWFCGNGITRVRNNEVYNLTTFEVKLKQPKKINKEVVEKSIKKYGLNDYENYAISDSGFLKLISLSSSVNTFIIFDKNKKLVFDDIGYKTKKQLVNQLK